MKTPSTVTIELHFRDAKSQIQLEPMRFVLDRIPSPTLPSFVHSDPPPRYKVRPGYQIPDAGRVRLIKTQTIDPPDLDWTGMRFDGDIARPF